MEKSEQINELAAALAKAQGEINHANKSVDNPFFKSKYADLAEVLDASRKQLSKYGLSIVQVPNREGYLETILMHSSGQWIGGSEIELRPGKPDMQGFISALTYARRGGYSAMVGVAQDDDDGNSTQQPIQVKKVAPRKPPAKNLTDKQLKRLYAITKTNGWKPENVKAYMVMHFNLDSSKKLNKKQYDELCHHIEKNPKHEDTPGGEFEDFTEAEAMKDNVYYPKEETNKQTTMEV